MHHDWHALQDIKKTKNVNWQILKRETIIMLYLIKNKFSFFAKKNSISVFVLVAVFVNFSFSFETGNLLIKEHNFPKLRKSQKSSKDNFVTYNFYLK